VGARLQVVDSAAQLSARDQGCLAITGSHGGLSAARYAWVARPWLVVFNDAGVGKDQAGIAGLDQLAQQGIAAATVSHTSARIGDASSTLADGVISYVNAPAKLLGLQPGVPLAVWINTQDTPTA